jgi:hypothetical protein
MRCVSGSAARDPSERDATAAGAALASRSLRVIGPAVTPMLPTAQ